MHKNKYEIDVDSFLKCHRCPLVTCIVFHDDDSDDGDGSNNENSIK